MRDVRLSALIARAELDAATEFARLRGNLFELATEVEEALQHLDAEHPNRVVLALDQMRRLLAEADGSAARFGLAHARLTVLRERARL